MSKTIPNETADKLKSLKRYDIQTTEYPLPLDYIENPKGEWVRWRDVYKILWGINRRPRIKREPYRRR